MMRQVLSSLRFDLGLDSSASTFRIALSLGFLYHCFTCRRDGREPHGSRLAFTRPARPSCKSGFYAWSRQPITQHRPSQLLRVKTHISPSDWASSTDDYQQRYAREIFHG